MNNKDFANLSLDELLKEERKFKKNETISKFIIGFLVGVLIYGIAKKGFGFLHIFLPLVLISGIYKYSQNLKKVLMQIQSEIKTKNTN